MFKPVKNCSNNVHVAFDQSPINIGEAASVRSGSVYSFIFLLLIVLFVLGNVSGVVQL